MKTIHLLPVFCAYFALLGCGSSAPREEVALARFQTESMSVQDEAIWESVSSSQADLVKTEPERLFDQAGQGRAAQPDPKQKPDAPVSRKIIYTAKVDLVVEEFDKAQKSLLQVLEQQGGYVAKSEVRGSPGAQRLGNWTVRVPIANFRAFLTALDALGEPVRNATDSQDVTDEFYDLEARIKNKQVEEERLLDHLKKSTGKLEDILAVERELTRVRGEIEQGQGRLQKLSKLTELTTVTISLQERKDYIPPAAPTFATTIGRTFGGSLDALTTFGKGVLLVIVALVPWLPLLALGALLVWLFVRRIRIRRLQSLAGERPIQPLPST